MDGQSISIEEPVRTVTELVEAIVKVNRTAQYANKQNRLVVGAIMSRTKFAGVSVLF